MEIQINSENGHNYYNLLGCDQESSVDQILCEFKQRALIEHPDKNIDSNNASEKFQALLEAKQVLTDINKRKKYDFWLNSAICMSWKEWYEFTNKNQPVFHWINKTCEPKLVYKKNEKINKTNLLSKFRNYQI